MSSNESDVEDPGWQAINDALAPIYGDQEPKHFGTVVPYALGGPDPIHGISAYWREEPVPHWHYVTYGFSELWEKESEDPEWSGFGFELTFRLQRPAVEETPPIWALNLLQNLGRYVFQSGSVFDSGHTMNINGKISLEDETDLRALAFVEDPELGLIDTPHGKVRFVQLLGITLDELELMDLWNADRFYEFFVKEHPLYVTELSRASILNDPELAREMRKLAKEEGSSKGSLFIGEQLSWELSQGVTTLRIKATIATNISRILAARVPHGHPLALVGSSGAVAVMPGEQFSSSEEDGVLTLELPADLALELSALLVPERGEHRLPSEQGLAVVIEPGEIKDRDGNVLEVVG
jgi:hypothetical protein